MIGRPSPDSQPTGADPLRQLLLARLPTLRPRLHRFCARMCGSALDGEDVVQEALAAAFDRLDSLEDATRIEPWVFRIAHNRCLDLLRREHERSRRTVSFDDEQTALPEAEADGREPTGPIDGSLAALVGELPPMERATVLLKDVLQYSLREVAEVVDSTIGGVKAALHRGRARLRARPRTSGMHRPVRRGALDPRQRQLFQAYLDCFNRHDWDALRRLIAVDARLEVVGELETDLHSAPYFRNYAALPWPFRLALARVDGLPCVVHFRTDGGTEQPHSAVRIDWDGDQVIRVRDYVHVGYLLEEAVIEPEEI